MSKVYVKTMTRGRNRVVAVCDEEILGETLEGGRVPFKVSEGFYRGILGEVDEAIAAMRQATICNLVGKAIVEAAIECNMVHERAVIYFGDIPHAQIVKF
ncbi:DUF424 domain-containing protein [Candidatus Bathyarchaeota archaeon]|jgi:hypothetical protein|nr:MAG: DUF424 domain-containing protein [Candidatus Bathyarchaeota archaeon]